MAKIDTILQGAGLAVIVGLGIPVGLSVKFSDGKIRAEELQQEFGIAVWTFNVLSPKEFSSLKVELSAKLANGESEEPLGVFDLTFPNAVKRCDLRIYAQEKSVRVLCNGQSSDFALPFDLSDSAIHNLGGKGDEIRSGTFLLSSGAAGDLIATVAVD